MAIAVGFRGGPGTAQMSVAGASKDVIGTQEEGLGRVLDISLIEGTYSGLSDGGVLVHEDPAEDLALAVGDVVSATFPVAGTKDLRVVGIAVLGIVNTLMLSVFERTREIGLLRAVGMTRRQTRRMIRWEAVIIAVFGGVLGILVGTLLGFIAVQAMPDSFITDFGIPVGNFVIILVMCIIAGVLAAILPARRAARLNILDAIAHS